MIFPTGAKRFVWTGRKYKSLPRFVRKKRKEKLSVLEQVAKYIEELEFGPDWQETTISANGGANSLYKKERKQK